MEGRQRRLLADRARPTVAVPRPDSVAIPVAYPVAHGDEEMLGFLNSWLELKKKDKTVEKLFAHWIMGKSVDTVEPRWSIIRNVLHWVD